jgi:hypothetical protein
VLLRRFAPDLPVTEARSFVLAEDLLRDDQASFVCLAGSTIDRSEKLIALSQWQTLFPDAASAVFLNQADPEREHHFREAGVQLVIDHIGQLPRLIQMAKRHLAQAPPQELDWREAIHARLPWQPLQPDKPL